ncbi:MAG TPA: hypothetical protein VN903_07730 [Polyangia bacterium]|nr:hypothetical protein [Polyangia bacterium]
MGSLGLPELAIANLTLPELVVIALIVVVAFGATKLPGSLSDRVGRLREDLQRNELFHPVLRRSSQRRWTKLPALLRDVGRWSWSEWMVVGGAVLAGGGVLAWLSVPRH